MNCPPHNPPFIVAFRAKRRSANANGQ
jgi:hypothetical protein